MLSGPDPSAIIILYGLCAVLYTALGALVLARPPVSRSAGLLIMACVLTAAWCIAFILQWRTPIAGLAA